MKHWYESQSTELDRAYYERNALVAALAKVYPSKLARHSAEDGEWDDDWRYVVLIDSPAGQLSWHLHVSHMPLFEHLDISPRHDLWDGHTTVEKYERLASLCAKYDPDTSPISTSGGHAEERVVTENPVEKAES